jgi:glycosyltransferase involved in cell wall biosynthesis
MIQPSEPKISVIIPCLDGLEYIDKLFRALQKQTYPNFEIIFINSKCANSEKIEKKISAFLGLDVKVFSTPPLFPGDARNLGIKKSRASLVAFLDVRTIPTKSWLKEMYEFKILNNFDIVLGKFICKVETNFQESVQAITFGNNPSDSLPGSLLSIELFKEIGDFLEGARAGEDEEWLDRVYNSKYNLGTMSFSSLNYVGLPLRSSDLVKKWFFYSVKSAPINVANSQKGAYFFLAFLLLVYFFLNWNYIFTNDQWNESEYFIPHINKIVWSIFFLIYMFFRGIFLPYKKGVNLNYIFPYNWLILIYTGLLIDFSKLPGRILGYFYFLKSKLTN